MDSKERLFGQGVAKAGFEGENETEYFLYCKGDEVDLVWQFELGDGEEQSELTMSVTDAKRLIQALQRVLKMSGNDTPLPVSRSASEEL